VARPISLVETNNQTKQVELYFRHRRGPKIIVFIVKYIHYNLIKMCHGDWDEKGGNHNAFKVVNLSLDMAYPALRLLNLLLEYPLESNSVGSELRDTLT
jgi:hypothetical protein